MLRFLLLAVLLVTIARAFWRVVDGVVEGAAGSAQRRARSATAVKLVRDPVCGTFAAPGTALSLTSRSGTHYFCSEDCRGKFTG